VVVLNRRAGGTWQGGSLDHSLLKIVDFENISIISIKYNQRHASPVKKMVVNSLYWTTTDLDAIPDDGGWLRHEIIEGELMLNCNWWQLYRGVII
jgi:hypothetical protein